MPISIDTNVLIAFLIPPVSQHDELQFARASTLLESVSEGSRKAIISEIVLHEIYYVLVMRTQSLTVSDFCAVFHDILVWPGWLVDDCELGVFIQALELVEQHPKLEFSDAVIAARAEAHGAELATFDTRLAKAYGGTIWAES